MASDDPRQFTIKQIARIRLFVASVYQLPVLAFGWHVAGVWIGLAAWAIAWAGTHRFGKWEFQHIVGGRDV